MSITSNSFDLIPRIQSNYFFKDLTNMNKYYILTLALFILLFVIIFYFFSNNENKISSTLFIILEIFIFFILILVIVVSINNQGYNLTSSISNLLNGKTLNVDLMFNKDKSGGSGGSGGRSGNNQCDSEKNNEVFHISNNKHTYEEARKICSKYKSRLATYNEIENAYNNGANWCSYGWSEDQLALFPTQKEVYDNLKTITGHENDCGRQGVNGGFIDNPYVKFGVNCYGEKPEETQQDKEYMERLKLSYSPAVDDSTINEDAKNYIISPFNREKWKEK